MNPKTYICDNCGNEFDSYECRPVCTECLSIDCFKTNDWEDRIVEEETEEGYSKWREDGKDLPEQ